MKERILKIMEKEGLTSSRFAESIGIQRSAMSHIIAERNNPSLDVVIKILERYPYINSDWLLSGKGEMCRSGQEASQTDASLLQENAIIFTDSLEKSEYRKEIGVEKPVYRNQQTENEKVISPERPVKKINKIMVFYSDNTFDTFIPEKKPE